MRILVISSILPYPPTNGGAARLYNLYRRLSEKHHITWVSPLWDGGEKYVPDVETFCDRVIELPQSGQRPLPTRGWRGLLMRILAQLHWERLFIYAFGLVSAQGLYWLPSTPERVAVITNILAQQSFDLVISEFEGNAELGQLPVGVPKILSTHNTLSSIFQRIRKTIPGDWQDRLFYFPELMKIQAYEKNNYKEYDYAIAVSNSDRLVLQKRCPLLPVELIPNGVDTSYFRLVDHPIDPNLVVYVGNYGYAPNADAVKYFIREIFPLVKAQNPNIKFMAIGAEPPKELIGIEGVECTGYVEDIRPYLSRSCMLIAPIRLGGGTRLKILDAFSMGKAVVSTRIGAEGLEVSHQENILLADQPMEFAKCVLQLTQDAGLRSRLGASGRKLVEEKYDWNALAIQMDALFAKVVAQSLIKNRKSDAKS